MTTGLTVTVFCDGACSGNPGKAATGVYGVGENGDVLFEQGEILDGEMTNNEAEYRAVLRGLRACRDIGATDVTLQSDSQLVVRQITEEYACNLPNLAALRERVWRCAPTFHCCKFIWIPREKNAKADTLASAALGRVADKNVFNHFNFTQALKDRDFWHAEAGRYKRLYEELSDQQNGVKNERERAA